MLNFELIINNLKEIKASVTTIENLIRNGNHSEMNSHQSFVPSITISISKNNLIKLPFRVDFSGILNYSKNLSPVQLSLLITLFYDLQERNSGGHGFTELENSVKNMTIKLRQLLKDDEEPTLAAIRTAFQRFETDTLAGLNAEISDLEFVLRSKRLVLQEKHSKNHLKNCSIEVSALDDDLSTWLNEEFSISPYVKIRSRKVLYVPGGPSGFDRLFLDFFYHDHLVHEISLFFKPSIITYPDPFLRFMNASHEDIMRRKVVLEGFSTGRVSFDEFLNRETLTSMISFKNNKYYFYPPGVSQQQIEEHFIELLRMNREYDKYRLILTDSPFPFLLSLFELHSGFQPECYTVFFKHMVSEHDPFINSFVINDYQVLNSVRREIINMILNDPSTVTDKAKIEEEILEVFEKFRKNGPIFT